MARGVTTISPRAVLLVFVTGLFASCSPVLGRQVRTVTAESSLLSSELLRVAATPAALVQQRELRRAIANASESAVDFTLTTDIVLTAPFPELDRGANVSIIGKCKDRNGGPRRCIIDGAGKHTMFTGDGACAVSLEQLIVQNVFGNVLFGGCSFSARFAVFRRNVGPKGPVRDTRDSAFIQGGPDRFFRCDFVDNTALFGDGGAFNTGNPWQGPTLGFTDCTFRNNRALTGTGGAVYAENTAMIFRNVVFEGNSAASGGAIVTTASTLTAINTTFSNNTATNGRGGAVVVNTTGSWGGTYKYSFCRSTFRGNAANPGHRYGSSANAAFLTGKNRAPVRFCLRPVPGGVQAPKLLSLVQDCTGCSGCDGDCYGNGTCVLDPAYSFPSCRCNAFFDNASVFGPPCTQCQQGYTPQSHCRQCSVAYYHPASKPANCALCPGLSKVLEYTYVVNSINNMTAANGPLQCQQFCNVTRQPFNGGESPYTTCNMWVYMAQRKGAPIACAGKCFMLLQSAHCGMSPVMQIASYGISYQYIEPDWDVCDDD